MGYILNELINHILITPLKGNAAGVLLGDQPLLVPLHGRGDDGAGLDSVHA